MTALTNWAGNVTFGAARIHRPTSVPEVQELVAGSTRLRVLGSGHSFSPVADTNGDLVLLGDLPPRCDIAADGRSVTVSGGLRYGEIAPRLHEAGHALHNMGSLPHICVAGAAATGTHGSGDANPPLASSVVGLDVVTADGTLIHLDETDPRFPGAVVSLGTIGVVTAVTLRVEPTFDVAQTVYDRLPMDALVTHLDEVFTSAYSVSVFSTLRADVADQVWLKRRTDRRYADVGAEWLGATRADGPRHPVPGESPASCTEQLGRPGPWFERLPHFRLDHRPSSGAELQSEFLVPREHAVAAVEVLRTLAGVVAPPLQVAELRTVAADDRWLSMAHGRDSLALHFTWHPDPAGALPAVRALERALVPLAARPHWGKVFAMTPEQVQPLYPRLADARALRRELDPDDVFGNLFVDRYVDR
ncbi:MAG TPA: D-arabinono-1,4-lactone oxidase [Actinomycetes bacterium]|nr:D-arabinono-1,4-lactone oxidase [Actinomycetes bacterium]